MLFLSSTPRLRRQKSAKTVAKVAGATSSGDSSFEDKNRRQLFTLTVCWHIV